MAAGLRLRLELWAWRRAGRTAQLWWRDDDAREVTPALRHLLALAGRHATPLTLAVIPSSALGEIAGLLRRRPEVILAQHGVDHRNRRSGPAAGEFPHDWTEWEVATRLETGWMQLEGLPGARRIYVPPWNDVHPDLVAALASRRYLAWSAWGTDGVDGDPPRLDAHLDLLRWRKGPGFRGRRRFESTLRSALRQRRLAKTWDAPIGLMTHHLDHDERAWRYLQSLLDWTHQEPALAWRSLEELIVPAPARPREQAYSSASA